jgi:hypothetical protein
MIIDLTPLRLTPQQQYAFCVKRMKEQCDYVTTLSNHPREQTLTQSAYEIRDAFFAYAKRITLFHKW